MSPSMPETKHEIAFEVGRGARAAAVRSALRALRNLRGLALATCAVAAAVTGAALALAQDSAPPGDTGMGQTPIPACPTDATFCSGFEENALPMGTRFDSNPPAELQFDQTNVHSGKQAVFFPAAGGPGFNLRHIVVPIPGQSYWARLFMRIGSVFGDNSHDSVFIGSTTMGDNNSDMGVEFSEQGNQVLLNSKDQLFAQGGPGFPSTPGPQLPADTWVCVEAFFDGGTGDVQIFADGAQLIDAPAFKKLTYQTFRFGYLQFNDPRDVWFDDVAVAPTRIGCKP